MNGLVGVLIVAGLAIVAVVLVAYVLGKYLRERDQTRARNATPVTPPPTPAVPPSMPKRELPAAHEVNEREVKAITSWLVSQAFEQTGVNVAKDKIAYQRIVEAATLAARDLQTQDGVRIALPFLTADATGPKHLDAQLSRVALRELIED